ncbi:MFS transporter [Brevibacillus fluminis]|uniref:MFS transporter n=1 Tax=Brevibacillus fluminis TaxID=511487 RepID=A0A3M8DSP4_9BACL|nr:MFS transporter [Brevibacillus fluminis]RNB91190.1 MFS transporter [Brevibacillus fluminis]
MNLLRNRTFLLLMIGESIAGAGLWIFIIGNLQFMQHIVPSDTVKGLILMAGLMAGVLLSPKAGALIDRSDKKKILFTSSLLRCASPLLMIPAIDHQSIFIMICALVIQQASNAFYLPAVQSSLPAILGPSELLRGNSIYLNVTTISRIGGTALGGVLVASLALDQLYWFTFAANIFLAVATLWMTIPKQTETKARPKQAMRFSEVFSLIKREPAVIIGLCNTFIITLLLGGFNLLVLKYSEIQHSPEVMGWIYTVEGTSILIAGLISKQLIGNRNLVQFSSMLLFVFALSQFFLSFAESRLIVLVGFALFGVTVAFFFPSVTTIFQKRLPDDTHGRFFAFKGMLERVLIQVSVIMTGACLDLIGLNGFMWVMCGATFFMGVFSLVYGKRHPVDVRQHQLSNHEISG